jgi:hypothetical protein
MNPTGRIAQDEAPPGSYDGPNPYAAPAAPLDAPGWARDVFRPRRWHVLAVSVTLGLLALLCIGIDIAPIPLVRSGAVELSLFTAGLALAALSAVTFRNWRERRSAILRPCRQGLAVRSVGLWQTRRGVFPWSDFIEARVEVGQLSPAVVVVVAAAGSTSPIAHRFPDVEFSAPPAVVAAALRRYAADPALRADLTDWDELE